MQEKSLKSRISKALQRVFKLKNRYDMEQDAARTTDENTAQTTQETTAEAPRTSKKGGIRKNIEKMFKRKKRNTEANPENLEDLTKAEDTAHKAEYPSRIGAEHDLLKISKNIFLPGIQNTLHQENPALNGKQNFIVNAEVGSSIWSESSRRSSYSEMIDGHLKSSMEELNKLRSQGIEIDASRSGGNLEQQSASSLSSHIYDEIDPTTVSVSGASSSTVYDEIDPTTVSVSGSSSSTVYDDTIAQTTANLQGSGQGLQLNREWNQSSNSSNSLYGSNSNQSSTDSSFSFGSYDSRDSRNNNNTEYGEIYFENDTENDTAIDAASVAFSELERERGLDEEIRSSFVGSDVVSEIAAEPFVMPWRTVEFVAERNRIDPEFIGLSKEEIDAIKAARERDAKDLRDQTSVVSSGSGKTTKFSLVKRSVPEFYNPSELDREVYYKESPSKEEIENLQTARIRRQSSCTTVSESLEGSRAERREEARLNKRKNGKSQFVRQIRGIRPETKKMEIMSAEELKVLNEIDKITGEVFSKSEEKSDRFRIFVDKFQKEIMENRRNYKQFRRIISYANKNLQKGSEEGQTLEGLMAKQLKERYEELVYSIAEENETSIGLSGVMLTGPEAQSELLDQKYRVLYAGSLPISIALMTAEDPSTTKEDREHAEAYLRSVASGLSEAGLLKIGTRASIGEPEIENQEYKPELAKHHLRQMRDNWKAAKESLDDYKSIFTMTSEGLAEEVDEIVSNFPDAHFDRIFKGDREITKAEKEELGGLHLKEVYRCMAFALLTHDLEMCAERTRAMEGGAKYVSTTYLSEKEFSKRKQQYGESYKEISNELSEEIATQESGKSNSAIKLIHEISLNVSEGVRSLAAKERGEMEGLSEKSSNAEDKVFGNIITKIMETAVEAKSEAAEMNKSKIKAVPQPNKGAKAQASKKAPNKNGTLRRIKKDTLGKVPQAYTPESDEGEFDGSDLTFNASGRITMSSKINKKDGVAKPDHPIVANIKKMVQEAKEAPRPDLMQLFAGADSAKAAGAEPATATATPTPTKSATAAATAKPQKSSTPNADKYAKRKENSLSDDEVTYHL